METKIPDLLDLVEQTKPLAPHRVPASAVHDDGQRQHFPDCYAVEYGGALLDEPEAAVYLRVKPSTLAVWRSTKRYKIPYIKVGRNVRYRRSDLDAWLASRTCIKGE